MFEMRSGDAVGRSLRLQDAAITISTAIISDTSTLKRWDFNGADAVLIPARFYLPGQVRYLRRLIAALSGGVFELRMILAPDGDTPTSQHNDDLRTEWEVSPRAMQFTQGTNITPEVPGTDYTGNLRTDSTEAYSWRPPTAIQGALQTFFFTTIDTGLPLVADFLLSAVTGKATASLAHVTTSDATGRRIPVNRATANPSAILGTMSDATGFIPTQTGAANAVSLRLTTGDATGFIPTQASDGMPVNFDVSISDGDGAVPTQTANANRVALTVAGGQATGQRLNQTSSANGIDFDLALGRATGRALTQVVDANPVEIDLRSTTATGRALRQVVGANSISLQVGGSDATGFPVRVYGDANPVAMHVATSDAGGFVPTQTGAANEVELHVEGSDATGVVDVRLGTGNPVELRVAGSDADGRHPVATGNGNGSDLDVSSSDATGRALRQVIDAEGRAVRRGRQRCHRAHPDGVQGRQPRRATRRYQ